MKCDKIVGFKYFLDKAQPSSQYGKLYLKHLEVLNDFAEVNKEQQLLLDIINLDSKVKKKLEDILVHFKNIRLTLDKIKNRSSVDSVDLFEVKVQALKTLQLFEHIDTNKFNLRCVKSVLKVLDPTDEKNYTFSIYGKFDSEYDSIVKRKKEIEKVIASVNGQKANLLKLERDKIIIEELRRSEIVLTSLVNSLSTCIQSMIDNIEVVSNIDVKLAFAKVYENYSYCLTKENIDIKIDGANLPLISDTVKHFTLLHIDVERGSTLITGANMGGKSTILKNLAFQVMLTMHGLLPLASKFEMPFINKVMYLSSFEDTTHGLSRFGNEITMLSEYLDCLDENSLFLVDEFASSTNPTEGYLFVKSLIRHCNKLPSFSVFTTHYDNLNSECITYAVTGLKESDLDSTLSLSDLMDYSIKKCTTSDVPKQALLVAKHMKINSSLLELLEEIYKERE